MAKMFGLSEKVGEFTIVEAFGIAVSKSVGERLLTPFVGNGTLVSAGAKGVLGAIINTMATDKIGNMISTGLIVDAGEDLVNFILPANALSSLITAPSNQSSRRVL